MKKMNDEIQHHLSDDLLFGYSAGTLPEAFNLIVAAHVSVCDQCRAVVESYDALGGALVEQAIPGRAADEVAMTEGTLSAVLDRIGADPSQQRVVAPPKPSCGKADHLPQPVRDYIGGGLDAVRWRPVGMGVRQAILSESPSGTARLLYIPAGTAVPDHGHKGTELTMVLQGAFVDENDYFGRGDVEIADQDVVHTPIADVSEDCICLAVTDAPLRFRKLMPRLLQPFFRI